MVDGPSSRQGAVGASRSYWVRVTAYSRAWGGGESGPKGGGLPRVAGRMGDGGGGTLVLR
jgi:hypothetical protein